MSDPARGGIMLQHPAPASSAASTVHRGTVLIVDSDATDRALLREMLQPAGWSTVEAAHGHTALLEIDKGDIDVMTLAIDLDAESGYDLCAAVRTKSPIPIIFLTHRRDDRDHAFALDQGGDAFLSKPCNARVLNAELAAALRRAGRMHEHSILQHGTLALDHVAHRVTVSGKEVSLSKTEFDLLAQLMADAHRACSRTELLEHVWGAWFGDAHVVEVTVARLRRKLAAGGAVNVIRTIPRIGYGLHSVDEQRAA